MIFFQNYCVCVVTKHDKKYFEMALSQQMVDF